MKKCLLLITGLIFIAVSSCEYKNIEPIEVELPDEEVSFTQQIQPIFDDKCVSCHSSTNPVLSAGDAYNNLIQGNYVNTEDPEASNIYQKMLDEHPAGNSMSATERALLLKWIEEGAQDN